jgi:hypothetical protein
LHGNNVVGQFACLLTFAIFSRRWIYGIFNDQHFKEETSVNASEYELISSCLYHLMAPVAADERLHLQGFLYSSVWNVIAPAFHEYEISQDWLYCVASEWLQNECSSAGLGT